MIASLSMDSIERQENMLHNVSQLFLKARQGFCVSALHAVAQTYIYLRNMVIGQLRPIL